MTGTSLLLGVAAASIFLWQFDITRILLNNPFASMDLYYYGRAAMAVVAACAFYRVAPASRRDWGHLSVPMALIAGAVPVLLAQTAESKVASQVLCLLVGAASTWLYLVLFRMYSLMPIKVAVTQLLGALALSYLARVALGFVPLAALPLVGFVFPLASVLLSNWGMRLYGDAGSGAASPNNGAELDVAPNVPTRPQKLFKLLVAEFTVFGFVAGFVRTPYEMAQFDFAVGLVGSLLLSAATLALLWQARRKESDVHFVSVCQIMLFLLLTVLLALALFGDVSSVVASVASLFARFGVYTLLLYVLCVFDLRGDAHPYATFGFGWGFFSLATGLGITVAHVSGISQLSALVVLAIVYGLFAVSSFVASRAKGDDALGVLADSVLEGEAVEDAGELFQAEILRRCESVGRKNSLTPREIEVMQLICLGRSKSYIAEAFSITENTARGYAKNVYRKLDIHSRQELLTLVGIK